METDVLLYLNDTPCRVEDVGTHELGSVHTDPQIEPDVDEE